MRFTQHTPTPGGFSRSLLRTLLVGFAVLCGGQIVSARHASAAAVPQAPPPENVNAVPRIAPGVTPTLRYYHHDATGNVVATTDTGGSVTWRAEMQPFGLGESGPEDRPLRFVDRPIEDIGDEAVAGGGGLYQLGARFYDPLAGRFMGVDPLALTDVPLEEPQRFNRFAYALNNPYRYVDTSGANADDPRKVLLEVAKSLPEIYTDPGISGSRTPVRELAEKLAKLPVADELVVEGAKVAQVSREGFMHWLRNAWSQGAIKTLQSAPRSTTQFKPFKLPGLIGIGITLALSAPSIAEAAESSSERRYGSTLAVGYEYLRGSVAIANPLEYELLLNKLNYSLNEAVYGLFGWEEYLPPRVKTNWETSQEGVQELFNAINRWLAEE